MVGNRTLPDFAAGYFLGTAIQNILTAMIKHATT